MITLAMPSRQLNATLWRSSSSTSISMAMAHHVLRASAIPAFIGGGITALIVVGLLCFIVYCKLRSADKTSSDFLLPCNLRKYSYHDLKWATQGFSNHSKIGQGGFGAVYKGMLRNGQAIAVKKLDTYSLQGERNFLNEMSVIGNLSSPHIVGLLGICAEEKNRLLVYEYMHNGSLQEALFHDNCPISLDWSTRFRIIVDIAHGLTFLHTKCDPAIIHGDVKPSNILLDNRLSARIADFGLARLKNDANGPDIRSEDVEEQSTEKERNKPERIAQMKEKRCWKKGVMQKARYLKGEKEDDSVVAVLQNNSLGKNSASETTASPTSQDQSIMFSSDQHDITSLEEDNQPGDKTTYMARELHVSLQESYQHESVLCDWGKDSPGSIDITNTEVSCESLDIHNLNEIPLEERSPDMSKELKLDDKFSQLEKLSIDSMPDQQFPGLKCDEDNNSLFGGNWWQRKDGGCELSVKDYVMDWMGNDEGMQKQSHDLDSMEGNAEEENLCDTRIRCTKDIPKSSESWKIEHEECQEKIELAKKETKKQRTNTREYREWWKEEYCAELSNKRKRTRGLVVRMRRGASLKQWSDDDLSENGCIKKAKRKDKKRTKGSAWRRGRSLSTECWSGDILNKGVSSTPSMRGTICYVAPENGGGGYLSDKSDVYSFGVLLLVIVSGRRPLHVATSPLAELEKANLISWARHLAESGNVLDLVDVSLNEDYDKDQALLCIMVALLCLQRHPAGRPNMMEVMKILSGELDVPSLPRDFSPSPSNGIPFRSHSSSDHVSVDFSLLA